APASASPQPARIPEADKPTFDREMAIQQAAEQKMAHERSMAAEAAALHAAELAKYLSGRSAQESGTPIIAVIAISEDGKLNRRIADAVAGRLQTADFKTVPSFFQSSFVSDGLFETYFKDPAGVWSRLELTNALHGVLFVCESINYRKNPDLENVLTADG